MTTPAPLDRTVAMIGGGQMALALAEGFCRAGLLTPADITVYEVHDIACHGGPVRPVPQR